ncbi:MAG: hypothetical protein O2954_06060 [bacterium]|nr:hypothetical protein [bacterium]
MATKNLPQKQMKKQEGSKKEPGRRKAAATLETELFTENPVKRIGISIFLYYLVTGVLVAMLLGTYSFLYFGDVQAFATPGKRSSSRVVETLPEYTIEKLEVEETFDSKDKPSFSIKRSTQEGESGGLDAWDQAKQGILEGFSDVLYSLEDEKTGESVFEGEEYQEILCTGDKLVLVIRARIWEKIEGQKQIELIHRVHKLAQAQNARTTPQTDLELIVLKFDDGRQDLVFSIADEI